MVFGRRRAEATVLQLYGKLPLAKDYLRLGMAEGLAAKVRDWMDRQLAEQVPSVEDLESRIPVWILLSDGSRSVFQGCLWASADAGWHRAFPFCLGVQLDLRRFRQELVDQPWALASRWSSLRRTFRAITAEADGRSLLAHYRGAELEAMPEPPGSSGHGDLELARWCNGVFPRSGLDGLDEWIAASEPSAMRGLMDSAFSADSQGVCWLLLALHRGLISTGEPFYFSSMADADGDLIARASPGQLGGEEARAVRGAWDCTVPPGASTSVALESSERDLALIEGAIAWLQSRSERR